MRGKSQLPRQLFHKVAFPERERERRGEGGRREREEEREREREQEERWFQEEDSRSDTQITQELLKLRSWRCSCHISGEEEPGREREREGGGREGREGRGRLAYINFS